MGRGRPPRVRRFALRRTVSAARRIDLDALRPAGAMVVDCFADADLERVLLDLGRVGLGEVWTYLRPPHLLSAGQRWRLKLALGLRRATRSRVPGVLVADEFCALLDRVTAAVVARCLRRSIDDAPNTENAPAAIVATCHDDLRPALRPDVVVTCDFGKITVEG